MHIPMTMTSGEADTLDKCAARRDAEETKAALEQGETTINAVRQRHGLSPIKGSNQGLKKLN